VKKMMIFLHKNAINIDAINVSHISCGWFGKCVMSNTNIDSAPLIITVTSAKEKDEHAGAMTV